jgi:WG containing repeat
MCHITHGIYSKGEGRLALLSSNGESWLDIEAERIGINLEDGLLTFLKDGKWGLVDTAGQVMLQPAYDDPVFFKEGFRGIAWVRRDNRWCPIDRRGHDVQGIACTDKNPLGAVGRFECKVER